MATGWTPALAPTVGPTLPPPRPLPSARGCPAPTWPLWEPSPKAACAHEVAFPLVHSSATQFLLEWNQDSGVTGPPGRAPLAPGRMPVRTAVVSGPSGQECLELAPSPAIPAQGSCLE